MGSDYLPYSFGGSLLNSEEQISGVFHADTPCFGAGTTDIPFTGSLDRNNQLTITSSSVAGQVLTLEGKLSQNGGSLTDTSFAVTGGCTGTIVSLAMPDGLGATIQSSAFRLPLLDGVWQSSPQFGISFTETLNQAPPPDAHGNFALSGSLQVQGIPCFSHGTLQAGSYVSGRWGKQIVRLEDGSTLEGSILLLAGPGARPKILFNSARIAGGPCAESVGVLLQ